MSEPVCEVCGLPATMFVMDIKEIEPFADDRKPPTLWRRWEPAGVAHSYCADHLRQPLIHVLPGHPKLPPAGMIKDLAGSYQRLGLKWGIF